MSEIRKKDGTIYNSCPFIDELLSLSDSQVEIINKAKEILEKVRKINEALRIEAEEARREVWEDVGCIINSKRRSEYVKSDLEDLVDKFETLRDENKDLLKQIENME